MYYALRLAPSASSAISSTDQSRPSVLLEHRAALTPAWRTSLPGAQRTLEHLILKAGLPTPYAPSTPAGRPPLETLRNPHYPRARRTDYGMTPCRSRRSRATSTCSNAAIASSELLARHDVLRNDDDIGSVMTKLR
jgi:hypothetical protein